MFEKAVFIHSLFRTGSTYVWHKFRRNEKYRCYYEPLHQDLVSLNTNRPDLWEYGTNVTGQMRFPSLDRSLTHEYQPLLKPDKKRLPLFRKSFSFDEFCRNSANSGIKMYIDSLLEQAGSCIPVLQFNRTALRIRWFKENYPHATHIYLVRHPHNQFQSYLSMMTENNLDIFLVMDTLIAGKNRDYGMLKRLGARIPLFRYRDRFFANEYLIYRLLSRCYSDWERYYIFYFIWFYSLFENVRYADLLINMDLLTQDRSYQKKISHYLKLKGLDGVDFHDACLRRYTSFRHSPSVMREIEKEIHRLFAQHVSSADFKRFHSRLVKIEKESGGIFSYFGLPSHKSKINPIIKHELGNDFEDGWLTPLAREIAQKSRQLEKLKKEVVKEKTRLFPIGIEAAKLHTSLYESGRLSRRKNVELNLIDKNVMKINRKLEKLGGFFQNIEEKISQIPLHLKNGDVRTVPKSERSHAMQHEFLNFDKWLHDQIDRVEQYRRLLQEKARLLRQKKRRLSS
jgi:hypothetical protein